MLSTFVVREMKEIFKDEYYEGLEAMVLLLLRLICLLFTFIVDIVLSPLEMIVALIYLVVLLSRGVK